MPRGAAASGPSEEPVRWRLVLAYDGRPFRGFAAQPNQLTVAGALAACLARTTRTEEPPSITCAGRTDAGVHAHGQVVHVDLPSSLPRIRRGGTTRPMDALDLVAALNRQLAPSIVVKEAAPAPPGFNARRGATARQYRYLVWNAPTPDPLFAPLSWHLVDSLELRAMAAGADTVIGEHDFGAFCRRPPGIPKGKPQRRRVARAHWALCQGAEIDDANRRASQPGRLLRFEIEADSFCHQMVRSLVALLIEVGRGKLTPADVMAVLRAGERTGLPAPAPPHGLCLVSVAYEGVA